MFEPIVCPTLELWAQLPLGANDVGNLRSRERFGGWRPPIRTRETSWGVQRPPWGLGVALSSPLHLPFRQEAGDLRLKLFDGGHPRSSQNRFLATLEYNPWEQSRTLKLFRIQTPETNQSDSETRIQKLPESDSETARVGFRNS